MRRNRPALTALVVVAATALVGCSPSNQTAIDVSGITDARAADPHEPIGPGGAISVTAFDLGFRDLEGIAIDGPVSVTLANVGQAEHNVRIDEAAGEGEPKVTALGGQTTEGVLQLFGAPGGAEYTYYCDIPGHKAAGMVGTLKVYLSAADAAASGAAADDMTAEPTGEPTEAEPTPEATAEPTPEPAPAADPADELVAGEVTEDSIAALDDSGDVEGALDGRGLARLYAVSFASGSSDLEASADAVLDDVVAWFAANPDKSVRVEGNTDTGGDADANQALSDARAQAVVDALIARGVDAARLTAQGNGENNTLVDDTDDDIAKRANRRVELHVIA